MIVDCHYHLDERMLNIEGLMARMDEAGVDRIALMALMVDPLPEPAPIVVKLCQFILTHRAMRSLGKILVENFTADGSLKLPMGTYRIDQDPDNAPVFDAAKRYPRRFLAWVFVNPSGTVDPVKEIDRWKDSPYFIGAKAHPFWHRYPPERLIPAARLLARLGKPLLIHAGFGKNGNFMPLLNEVSGLKLILAHTAFPTYSQAWKTIRPMKNVFVDLSQTTYVDEKTTRDAVEYLGAERCLFGTDGPFGPPAGDGVYDYGLIKKRIERLFPDGKTRRLILGETFERITGC